jgi:type III secretion protein V
MKKFHFAYGGDAGLATVMKKFHFAYGGDAGLVASLVAILALIVFPLPTWLIDILLGVNISVSVLLLMVTMYIPSAIALTSFPSLLLFTTLFRLALNIASTKLILLNADAGHIIDAFGRLVVGGNLVVGIVVFLIITIVQFIVIAKGSERVAEVGARFTLDAMPGKQMSIDADLRAGHLTGEEARRKRALLAMESQLHGGMDGAMKFVKGDAIAGLIITLINLLAGIVIGVTYHGMPAAVAANTFAVLSIGDAMVSQVPALLICVSAGLMITRVADDHAPKPRSLGEEIGDQLARSPQALYLAAALLCGFALVPGFPWFVFLLMAGALAALGRRISTRGATGQDADKPGMFLQREGAKGDAPGIEAKPSAFASPLAVALSPGLARSLSLDALNLAFEVERLKLQQQLGLPFPGIRFWTQSSVPDDQYDVLLHDVPAGRGSLLPGHALVVDPCTQDQARCRSLTEPGSEAVSWWIPAEARKEMVSEVLAHEQVVARHAVRMLHEQAHQFLGIQEVQWVLERVAADYPGLVAEAQKVLPLQRIAEVLRRLLEESVPIRNMRSICESLVVWGPKEKDVLLLTEYVRGDLGRYLSHRAMGGGTSISAVLLDADVEKMIREAIKPTPAGNYLALAPEVMTAIAGSIGALAGPPRPGLAVVTSMDIRRYVRRMIEPQFKWLSVYSFQELGPQVRLEPVGRVSL